MILVKARKSSRRVEKRLWVKYPKSGKPFQKTVWVLPGEANRLWPSAVENVGDARCTCEGGIDRGRRRPR